MSFLVELRRRSIFRVAATYLVAGWLILQVVSAVEAPLNLPDWFDTVVIVLLAIGFPIAVLFAWAFELTPNGIRVTRPSAAGDIPLDNRRLDYALIAALVIVAGTILWEQFGSRSVTSTYSPGSLSAGRSIAVLPFVDMSRDKDQEYFGDGIAEELLNELTRLDGLRVASRTSSFSFRGSASAVRAIGEALNVDLVLEGSVRKDDDRIRVTAQLINAKDGYHHWSKIYDTDLDDIFAVQDDIAEAIAGVLGVELGVGNVNSFRGAGTDSLEAYEAYLQANKFRVAEDRIRAFERAVQIDPNYAAALAGLGIGIASTMWTSAPEDAPEILDRAMPVLFRAIELRPDSAYAYSLLATANYGRFDWISSEQYYEKALSIARDGGTLSHHGNMLMRSGRSDAAIRNYDEAVEAERYPATKGPLSLNAYLALELYDEAREIASESPVSKYIAYLTALNKKDAQALVAAIGALPDKDPLVSEIGIPLQRIFDSPDKALELLRTVYTDRNTVWPSKYHDIALLAAFYGDPEFSLSVIATEVRLTAIRFGALWYPVMGEVRKLQAFRDLMLEINLVKYWRAYGWSNHCRPLGQQDFECF